MFGPQPAIAQGPSVIVGWSATVGAGGAAGPVHLQVFRDRTSGTVVGASPTVQLPAYPGQYSFPLPAGHGIKSATGSYVLGLAQQVGGHALLDTVPPLAGLEARTAISDPPVPTPRPLSAAIVDYFAPALADGAVDATPSGQRYDVRLALAVTTEPDADQDGLGDTTQDVGDLKIVSARIAQHLSDRALVVVRIRNVASTVRDRPGVRLTPSGGVICGCEPVGPLAPGAETAIAQWVSLGQGERRRRGALPFRWLSRRSGSGAP